MKYLVLVFLVTAIFFFPKMVRSEIIDRVVVEMNGEIIKLSDIKMEEKIQELNCLPPLFDGFRSKNDLERFVDETILAGVGLEKIEKHLASVNSNFGLWVEKRDEWSSGEYGDVLQIWSGHLDDFFKKVVLLGKVNEEDGKDLKKLIKDWKNLLLADLFFPGESRFSRRENIRKIIRITADKLDANFYYTERRFLKRALAKKALEKLQETVEGVHVFPREIKDYCVKHPLSLLEFQHILVKQESEAEAILEKIKDKKGCVSEIPGSFKSTGINLESLIPEFRQGILRVAESGLEMGYVRTDVGYHVIHVKKISFEQGQREISEILQKEKREKAETDFFEDLYKKSVIIYRR